MRWTAATLAVCYAAPTSLGCSDHDTVVGAAASQVDSHKPAHSQIASYISWAALERPEPKPEPAPEPEPEPEPPLPALSDLTVSGGDSALTPSFDDSVLRYSVRATDAVDELSVTATAEPEFSIEIGGVPSASGEPTVLPDAEPGSEIEIWVGNDEGLFRRYTLVYLPYEFPQIDVTVKEPDASSDPIYVALRSGGVYHVVKFDENGVPLFYRRESGDVSDFKKHPGGELSYAANVGNSIWEQVLLDSQFEEIDRVSTVGLVDTDHHDFVVQENGNFILMAYESTVHDLTEFGGSSQAPAVDQIFQELSPEREVLFQWNGWDHVSYDDNVRYPNTLADYAHMNGVLVDTDGNWIISARSFSQLLKIDRSSGEVLWHLGGKANEFRFIDDPFGGFCGQHNPRRLENGHLLLFDNGTLCWPRVPERGKLTRAAEYELDEEQKTARLVWSYHREGTFTDSAGSAQRLPNGNTFIGWGNSGEAAIATEVDPHGNIVFELEAQGLERPARSYRAYRFAD